MEVIGLSVADDLVEAIQIQEKRFVVGVQWHPEFMYSEGLDSLLFKKLVKSAAFKK